MRNSSMLNVLMYDKCIINELVAFVSLHLLATYSLVFPSFPSLLLVVNAWRDYNSEPHAWLHWETHWSSELKKSRRRSCLWDVPLGWRGQGLPGEGGRAGGRIMSTRDLTYCYQNMRGEEQGDLGRSCGTLTISTWQPKHDAWQRPDLEDECGEE